MSAPARRVTLVPLVGALYFMVSGGAYGLEELVQNVGFGVAIVVLLVTPVVWSVPTALMVGELASALPEEGGFYAWVGRAMGPFWGYQEAWLSLAASVFDMAIYPALFVLYLEKLCPALGGWPVAAGAAVVAGAALVNLAGARVVGVGSAALTALVAAPFFALAALALFAHGAPGPSGPSPALTASDLAAGVLVAMWTYMGWDNASTVAAEVDRPQRNYPRAVLLAVALVAFVYVVPVAAMKIAGVDPSAWDTGSWVDAARAFGGAPLAIAVVVGGMLSAFAMASALCLSYSRLPEAMAHDGYLPRAVGRTMGRARAPWVAILACSVAWTLSLGLSFEHLVSLDILLYGASLVLEFVALVVLRLREPELPRPFRVPGGTVGAAALGLGPVALLGVALYRNADERVGPVSALTLGLAVMSLGVVAFVATRAVRARATVYPDGA